MSHEQTAIALIKVYDRLRDDPPELWEREAAALAWAIAEAFEQASRGAWSVPDYKQYRAAATPWRVAQRRHLDAQAELEQE